MKILFLDIDGVVNDHSKLPGSIYCGILHRCVEQLNRVVRETGCKIVLSSAWRYQILCGATSVRGFEFMLFSHGLVAPMGTLIGHTPSDETIAGRGPQIMAALYSLLPAQVEQWAVVDDLDIVLPVEHMGRFVQTHGMVGMTWADADRLIGVLNGEVR